MRCFPVLLIALLLAGCTAHAQTIDQTVCMPQAVSLLEEISTPEASAKGAVACYSLGQLRCSSILPFSDSLLLLSDTGENALVQKLDSSTCAITASLEFPASSDSASSLSVRRNGFSWHDAEHQQTLVIDDLLEIKCQIPDPEGLTGNPVLSGDGHILYYCTASAIRALDLQTGISRILKETAYSTQTVSGLLLNDSILHCRLQEGEQQRSLFLCTDTGNTLCVSEKTEAIFSNDTHFYAYLVEGKTRILAFGTQNDDCRSLVFPEYGTVQFPLPTVHRVLGITKVSTGEIQLNLYDLQTGLRQASQKLSVSGLPRAAAALTDGTVWLLMHDENNGSDTLYRWNPSLSPIIDPMEYTAPYNTREAPDLLGIGECTRYAQTLKDRYSIDIRTYKDVIDFQTGEVRVTYEHLPQVMMWELEQLDENLRNFPPDFLQTISQRFGGLSICILRDISVSSSQYIPNNNCGLFWKDNHPFIALVSGTDTRKGLYHSLCHLTDTIVLNGSSAYDTWNQHNPSGFTYDYDYAANEKRNSTAFLLDNSRYFVDMFSMSFPKEDRARIMEYAMTPEHGALFQTEAMQNKLRTICVGIREAFHLEKCTDAFLWEQYLHKPINPSA